MNNVLFTWNTTKVANGFRFSVTRMVTRATPNASGLYADSEVVQHGVVTSRAIAKAHAQKWARFLRSKEMAA